MSAPRGMVRVFQPADATELVLARAALEAAGIRFFVENEHYSYLAGGGFLFRGDTPVWVQVPQAHAEEARATILESIGRNPEPDP